MHQNNCGTLRRHPEKTPCDPAMPEVPDYFGEATVNGQQMDIQAWIIKQEGGGTYMSLRFLRDGQLVTSMQVPTSDMDRGNDDAEGIHQDNV